MKKLIVGILLILLVIAGILLVKTRKQAVDDLPVARPVIYAVRTVVPETNKTIVQHRTFLGRLESEHSAGIASKLSGRISEMLVRESQRVSRGDLLLRIDDQEISSSISSLQARLTASLKSRAYNKTLLARNRALFEAGGLAREKLEASEVSYSTAAAAVTEIEQSIAGLNSQLEYSRLQAPFDGIVGTVFFRQGDLATPGRILLTLNSLSQKITFSFTTVDDSIQPGQEVWEQGRKLGTITALYDDARAGLRVAEVALEQRVNQPNGSYLTIEVVTKSGTGCSVPVESLLHRSEGVSIMVYEQGNFHEKAVNILAQDARFALIEPCVSSPVAVASEAKLSLLPTSGGIKILVGDSDE